VNAGVDAGFDICFDAPALLPLMFSANMP